jgi:hypothetical protein
MDVGCGFDLVGQASTQGCPSRAAEKLNFGTASGTVLAQTGATFQCSEVNQEVEPYVLPSTPRVLSIGRRCVEEGCSLVWPSGKSPTLYAPSGRALGLSVFKNTPYLEVALPGSAQLAMAGVPVAPSVAVEGIGAAIPNALGESEAPPGIFPGASAPAGRSTTHARLLPPE